jgi:hypothetical protein
MASLEKNDIEIEQLKKRLEIGKKQISVIQARGFSRPEGEGPYFHSK